MLLLPCAFVPFPKANEREPVASGALAWGQEIPPSPPPGDSLPNAKLLSPTAFASRPKA